MPSWRSPATGRSSSEPDVTSPPGSRAAAVIGAGLRTPAGNTLDELWVSLCEARPTAEVFRDDRLPAEAAALVCRVRELDPSALLTPAEVRRLDRSHVLALAAAH